MSVRRRAIPPLLLLVVGLWLLAGCFYLPLPEHPTGKHQKDFRNALGDAESKHPLRTGVATRRQVIARLGEPPYASSDGRSVAYLLYTGKGAWIYPLCFEADTEPTRAYAVRLDFDESDVLRGWETEHADVGPSSPFPIPPAAAASLLVRKLSQDRRPLKPTKPRVPASQPDAARKRAG